VCVCGQLVRAPEFEPSRRGVFRRRDPWCAHTQNTQFKLLDSSPMRVQTRPMYMQGEAYDESPLQQKRLGML
jgi:hypothetical protein